MVRIGKVIKSFIGKLSGSGSNAQVGSVEEFANDPRGVQYFGACNEDFSPPTNCKTIDDSLGRDRGFLAAFAYKNESIPPVALPGERRIFSTNEAGSSVKAEVFLKQDGTIDAKNDKAQALLDPDGKITLKNDGVTITATNAGLLTIVTSLNTEITSAKTIIKNDVDILGNLLLTGSLSAGGTGGAGATIAGNINMTNGIISGTNVFNGPDSDNHKHGGVTVGAGDTDVPKA